MTLKIYEHFSKSISHIGHGDFTEGCHPVKVYYQLASMYKTREKSPLFTMAFLAWIIRES